MNWILDHTFGYIYQAICQILIWILPNEYELIIRNPETGGFRMVFWEGIKTTMWIALFATCVGLILALVLGTLRTIKINKNDSAPLKILKGVMQAIIKAYVTVIRGTPMMVQAMILFYSFVGILKWSPTTAALVIVSINSSAYLTEVIKEAIESVDNGQTEAARSLGFSAVSTLFLVVFPQALKNCLASIGNEFVINIKDTSVLNVIGCAEMFFVLKQSASKDYNYQQQMIVGAIFYLILTSVTTALLRFIEKKMSAPVKGLTSSN